MPNRIIKESICTSDTVDKLTWFEEVVFFRLIVNCDDYGRFDGRPSVIRSRLFPLKANVTDKSVMESINKLSTVGLVILYEYEDKPYLQLATWDKHQQVRAKRSKYPVYDSTCNQMKSDDCICPRNPIQSESESESEIMPGAEAPDRTAVMFLTLNDKSEYAVYEEDVLEWRGLYPAVNILQELRNMKGWLNANPKNRKTKGGMGRFINGWLSREQNRGKPQKEERILG